MTRHRFITAFAAEVVMEKKEGMLIIIRKEKAEVFFLLETRQKVNK